MKPKIILTDADGVLLDWLTRFHQFMAEEGYELIPGKESFYSMTEQYNIDSMEARKLIIDYNKSHFMANLDSHADAMEYIPKLAGHGFKFVVITSISSHPDALKYRTINLNSLYGNVFQEIICLETGSDKDHVLKLWEGSDLFWLEDHTRNAEVGHSLGLRSILVQQDHNMHYETDHFQLVGPEEPWKEIYSTVCTEYNLPL